MTSKKRPAAEVLKMAMLALLLTLLTACAQTEVHGPLLDAGIVRLAAARPKTISYAVKASTEREIIGHQYAFILLPAGKVFVQSPHDLLQNAVFRALALQGTNPQRVEFNYSKQPELIFELTDISASAYDTLFVRRISAKVKIKITDTRYDVSIIASGAAGAWRAFGYKKQLEASLILALERCLQDGFEHLPSLGYRMSYEISAPRPTQALLHAN